VLCKNDRCGAALDRVRSRSRGAAPDARFERCLCHASYFAAAGPLEALNALDPRFKHLLVEALVVAIGDDGIVEVAEAELLRTTCALLHCPLPTALG
jgi:hypothetical protein